MSFVDLIKNIKDRESRLRAGSVAMKAAVAVSRSTQERQLVESLGSALAKLADEERDAAVTVSQLALAHSKEDFDLVLKALGG